MSNTLGAIQTASRSALEHDPARLAAVQAGLSQMAAALRDTTEALREAAPQKRALGMPRTSVKRHKKGTDDCDAHAAPLYDTSNPRLPDYGSSGAGWTTLAWPSSAYRPGAVQKTICGRSSRLWLGAESSWTPTMWAPMS